MFRPNARPFRFALGALVLGAALLATAAPPAAAAGKIGREFGLGVMFRDEVDFGVQARWARMTIEKINFVPQVGYFFDPNVLDFNFDAHIPLKGQDPNIYALAGANLATDFDDATEFGLNAGAGLLHGLATSLDGFLEVKYVFSDLDGFALQAGIHF